MSKKPQLDENVTLASLDAAQDLAEMSDLAGAVKPGLVKLATAADKSAAEFKPEPEPEPELEEPARDVTIEANYPTQGHWVPIHRAKLRRVAELVFMVPAHADPHRRAGAQVRVLVRAKPGEETLTDANSHELPYENAEAFVQYIAEF